MKSIIIVIILTFTSLICASSQTPRSSGQSARPKGRVLVNKLPAGVRGVTLKNGTVRLKPGYKAVKEKDGTVTVSRIAGGSGRGLSIAGTWSCDCSSSGGAGTGTCSALINGSLILCLNGTCTGSCQLSTTVNGLNQGIIMY